MEYIFSNTSFGIFKIYNNVSDKKATRLYSYTDLEKEKICIFYVYFLGEGRREDRELNEEKWTQKYHTD